MPAPATPRTLLAAARLYYLEGRSQARRREDAGHQPLQRLADAHRGAAAAASSRSGSTTRPAASTSSRTSSQAFGLQRRAGRPQRQRRRGDRVTDAVGTQAARLLLDELKDSHDGRRCRGATPCRRWSAPPPPSRATTVSRWSSWSAACPRSATRSAARSWSASWRPGSAPTYRFLHAPAMFDRVSARDALLAEPSIGRRARGDARSADIAFVGIGTPTPRLVGRDPRLARPLAEAEQDAFWATSRSATSRPATTTPRAAPSTAPSTTGSSACQPRADLAEIPNVVGVASGRAKSARRPRCPPRPPHRLPRVRREPRPQRAERRGIRLRTEG